MATPMRTTAFAVPDFPGGIVRLGVLVVLAAPQVYLAMGQAQWLKNAALLSVLTVAILLLGLGHLAAAFLAAWRGTHTAVACSTGGLIGSTLALFAMLRLATLTIMQSAASPGDVQMAVVATFFVLDVALVAYQVRECGRLAA